MPVAKSQESGTCNLEHIQHRAIYRARLAHELPVSGREFARIVLVRADSGYKYVVAVLPASKMIDLEKASKLLGGSKLELATEFDIETHFPDREFGVLSPFGSRYGMRTIADSGLDGDIWFAGNTHDEAIRMKFAEFCQLEHPLVAPLAAEQ